MNTEDDEFRRIEAEAKRREAQDDDDTQVYTSESAEKYSYRCGYEAGAAAAIKQALAQPAQEPVAYVKGTYAGRLIYDTINPAVCLPVGMALYTTPPAAQRPWVGLTDEEVRDLWSWSATSEAEKTANTQQHAFARAIEAKLKEKNT